MWVGIAALAQILLLLVKKWVTWDEAKEKRIDKTIEKVKEAGKNGDQQALEDAINNSNSD